MKRADVIYFSGITIAILDEEGRRNLYDALKAARALGKTIVYDPNLRPKLWVNVEDMRQSTTLFAQCSDIVMPSFEDEQVCFGDADTEATARRYVELGAQLVVVKNGDKEILIQRGSETYLFSPEPISIPIDTTAAGDSFNAGFLSAYLSGADVETAMKAGCDVAAQVIQNRGALIKTTVV